MHGAFPNRSPDRRATLVMSFHPRSAVVGVEAQNVHASKRFNQVKTIRYGLGIPVAPVGTRHSWRKNLGNKIYTDCDLENKEKWSGH